MSIKTGNEAPIKLMWNNSIGEGWILLSNEFYDLDDVTMLDMLKDFQAQLTKLYDETLEEVFPNGN